MSSNNKRTKRIFISDIHMGDDRSVKKISPYKHAYGWISKDRAGLLADFLEKKILKSDDVKELIILGDFFDQWVCPVGLKPPTFEMIIENSYMEYKRVIKNLKKIASPEVEIDLYYTPGNHDMLVGKEFMETHFPGIHFCGDGGKNYVGVYKAEADGIIAEHGNQYNFFNAPNPAHPDSHWLPVGFFLSRVGAEKVATKGGKPAFWSILPDFAYEYFGDKKEFVKDLFISVAKDCGLTPNSTIVMDGIDNFGQSITVEEVGNFLLGFEDQWNSIKPNGLNTFNAVFTQISAFRGEAIAKYFSKGKGRLAFFGHTHNPKLEGLNRIPNFPLRCKTVHHNNCDYIYANCGRWVDKYTPTYLETEITKNGRHYVRLFKYTKDKVTEISRRYIKMDR